RREAAFADVINGDDHSFVAVQEYVWSNRYFLSDGVTPARFTVAGLRTALASDLVLLGSDLAPVLGQGLPADPTNEAVNLLRMLGRGRGPRQSNGVWTSPDGSAVLLVLHTRASGSDLDAQQHDLAVVDEAFASARATISGARTARLQMTGPGVFGVRT